MRYRCLFVLAAITIAGCVSVKPVPLPDGQTGYAIAGCDGMAQCYKKAAEVCGGRYEMIDKTGTSAGGVPGAAGTVTGILVPQYSITIRCTRSAQKP